MAESYVTTLLLLDENKILTDLNGIAMELGIINNVFETSRIYLYYAVFARVLGNLTQTVAQYLNNIDIDTTTDEALLDQLLKPFIKKDDARVSKVILEFKRRADASERNNIFIPRDIALSYLLPGLVPTITAVVLLDTELEVLPPFFSINFSISSLV